FIRTDIEYSNRLLWISFPAFTAFYLLTAYYAGLYDRWYRKMELVNSTFVATIVLLAAYALLPEHYRFSRGIILFGALVAFVLMNLLRGILIKRGVLSSRSREKALAGTLIIGSPEEYENARVLMKEAGLEERILGRVSVDDLERTQMGHVRDLQTISASIPFREIIFCEGTLSFGEIIRYLQQLPANTSVKIFASGSTSIVGSDSKDSAGESLSEEQGFLLNHPYNRRLKRLVDVLFSIFGLLSFPVQLIIVKKPTRFFLNCLNVLIGRYTWVGYATSGKNLPLLRKSIRACNGMPVSAGQQLPAESLRLLDYWYAREYEPANDIKILWRMYRHLGD
ncbi:MAG TPA: hypothetical protein VFO70_04170, partial [Chitinophagaceae bacterium]|nr:hypothetical protein [Chitinophagaceae bacterium]